MAFDFGDSRIGVAVSDPDSILATPVKTVATKSVDLWDQIFRLLSEYEPVEIFVGKPIHLSGVDSDTTSRAEFFAREINERSGIEVTLIDQQINV